MTGAAVSRHLKLSASLVEAECMPAKRVTSVRYAGSSADVFVPMPVRFRAPQVIGSHGRDMSRRLPARSGGGEDSC